jgi:Protein of unknown function (DUF3887)
VLDATGSVIGINLSSSNSSAKNLKSSVIISALEAWHVPANNFSTDDVDSRRFAVSTDIISDLQRDDVTAVKSHFSPSIADQFSNQQIRSVWNVSVGYLGNYLSTISQTKRIVGTYTLYVTKMKFEKGNAELRIAFDSADAVEGIWLISVSDRSASEMLVAAKNVVGQLAQGQFQSVFDAFADSIRAASNVSVLSTAWNGVIATRGKFIGQTAAEKSTEADFVDVLCHFENGNIIVRVSFALSMQLVGVNLLPAS